LESSFFEKMVQPRRVLHTSIVVMSDSFHIVDMMRTLLEADPTLRVSTSVVFTGAIVRHPRFHYTGTLKLPVESQQKNNGQNSGHSYHKLPTTLA
jgi:hypothetical protein